MSAYYVDTAGNDGNSGLSEILPWLTVNKVNISSFNAGDSVSFKKTCTWRERLVPPSNGSSGSRITFGVYGTGDLPIISGADNITAQTWTQVGSTNVWYTTYAADPGIVWFDGVSYPEAASAVTVTSTARWFWSSGDTRIYVYATSSPNGFYTDIEAPNATRSGAMANWDSKYITFENLEFRYGTPYTFYLLGDAEGCIAQDCVMLGAGAGGAALKIKESANNCTVQRCTITGNDATGSGSDVVHISDDDSTTSGTTIQYCTIKNASHSVLKLLNASASIIQYNRIENDSATYGRALEVVNALNVGGNIVRYNWIEGSYVNGVAADGNKFTGWNNELYGNVFTTGNDCGLSMPSYTDNGVLIVTIGNKVYNNVFYGFTGGPVGAPQLGCIVLDDYGLRSPAGNLIKNNIIFGNNGTNHYQVVLFASSTLAAYTLTNNCIYDAITTSTVYDGGAARTVAYMEANHAAQWSANIVSDPAMTSPSTGDFTLQAGSPCIDTGVNLGATYQMALRPGSTWPGV